MENKFKYQVIFYDCNNEEVFVKQLFNTLEEANNWANNLEYNEIDEWYNPEISDYEFKIFYRFSNPEDNTNNYFSYEVRPIKNKLWNRLGKDLN